MDRRYNRHQIRSLLMPGIFSWEGRIGFLFSGAEIEQIIDAYISADVANPGDGVKGSIRKMNQLARWPEDFRAEATRTAQHLAQLKSVSKAYRKSAVHAIQARGAAYLEERKKEKQRDDDRKSLEALARSANQSGGLGQLQGAGIGQTAGVYAQVPPGGWPITYPAGGVYLPAGNYSGQLGLGPSNVQSPRKPLPTEVKAGEIVAWRCWVVELRFGKPSLRSCSMGTQWWPGQPMKGQIAKHDETTGVHAWKTRKQALDYMRNNFSSFAIVIGKIELWGKVVEHDLGYRAEYGQIKSLDEAYNLDSNYLRVAGIAPSLAELQAMYLCPISSPPRAPSAWEPCLAIWGGAMGIAGALTQSLWIGLIGVGLSLIGLGTGIHRGTLK